MESKEKQLRYSEAFYSVQGEGKFVGVPSVFLRTFGCNFRCMNFGTDENVIVGNNIKQVRNITQKYWNLLIKVSTKLQKSLMTYLLYIQVVILMQVSILNLNTSTN